MEYNIPTYDKETHRIEKYNFEELDEKNYCSCRNCRNRRVMEKMNYIENEVM